MRMRGRVALVAVLAAVGSTGCAVALARADATQVSIFQDDDHLIYSSPSAAAGTLAVLHGLGVQRIRVTVKWSTLAPDPDSTQRPAGFNAADPASYPASSWSRYDTVVRLASEYGVPVELNVTSPGPLWAMTRGSPTTRAADHWEPNPNEFAQFVYAIGTRYSGRYEHLPAVTDWSVWNEPNQPGWLAPQWLRINGREVATSPGLYRKYVNAAYLGLVFSGHPLSTNTFLIGELAPEGSDSGSFYTAMTPMPFMRDLYCVDRSYHRLHGGSAARLGCPASGSRQAFVKANPGLFNATGFAHHPYYFFRPPATSASDPNDVPIANLSRLERGLDRAFRNYGVHRRIPVYLTEYGYQTNPPDIYQTVTPAEQAVYLNEADYMAWNDPRVRSVAQFLLLDAQPDRRYAPSQFDYWDTFQTGLLFSGGAPKPALYAYRMPIWVRSPHVRRGHRLAVWGQLRAAPHDQPASALIQWRGASGAFRTIARHATRNSSGYFLFKVTPPGSGSVRVAYQTAGGGMIFSRTVRVRVG
jgi:Cellulase (glycosyl hydrolase family 5)